MRVSASGMAIVKFALVALYFMHLRFDSKLFREDIEGSMAHALGLDASANVPGLNVGGKTGTGDKWDPVAKRYSTTKQVSSFAAVFPTDGALTDPRYFVLILLDVSGSMNHDEKGIYQAPE